MLSKTNDLTRFAALTNAEMPKKIFEPHLACAGAMAAANHPRVLCPHSDRSVDRSHFTFLRFSHFSEEEERGERQVHSEAGKRARGQRVASFKFKRCLERRSGHVLLELPKKNLECPCIIRLQSCCKVRCRDWFRAVTKCLSFFITHHDVILFPHPAYLPSAFQAKNLSAP